MHKTRIRPFVATGGPHLSFLFFTAVLKELRHSVGECEFSQLPENLWQRLQSEIMFHTQKFQSVKDVRLKVCSVGLREGRVQSSRLLKSVGM